MTETPKNEPSQETGTARSQDNVVRVDFNGSAQKAPSGEVQCSVFYVADQAIVGLEFSQPVVEFRMGVDALGGMIASLVQVYQKLKDDENKV